MTDAFIYDAVRSPRGKGRPDGSLHEVTAVALSAQVLDALRMRKGDPVARRHRARERLNDGACGGALQQGTYYDTRGH